MVNVNVNVNVNFCHLNDVKCHSNIFKISTQSVTLAVRANANVNCYCINRVLILNSILDSHEDQESSVNLLLNGSVSHLTLLVSLKYFYLKQQADRKL